MEVLVAKLGEHIQLCRKWGRMLIACQDMAMIEFRLVCVAGKKGV